MKTDSELRADVRAERLRKASVNAARIKATLKTSAVTSINKAGVFAMEFHPAARAPLAAGVRALAEKLVIARRTAKRSDADIGRLAREAFMYVTYVPQHNIRISVADGCVTLTGEVAWEYQRKAAADGIRGLAGVTGVRNKITIEHAVSSQQPATGPRPAPNRKSRTRGRPGSIASHGMGGTFRGPPQSFQDRDLAPYCAPDNVQALGAPQDIPLKSYLLG